LTLFIPLIWVNLTKKVATDMLINFTIWSQPINCTIPNAKPTQGLYPSPIQIRSHYRSKVLCFDWSEWKTVQLASEP
jgi:hypothetical protein